MRKVKGFDGYTKIVDIEGLGLRDIIKEVCEYTIWRMTSDKTMAKSVIYSNNDDLALSIAVNDSSLRFQMAAGTGWKLTDKGFVPLSDSVFRTKMRKHLRRRTSKGWQRLIEKEIVYPYTLLVKNETTNTILYYRRIKSPLRVHPVTGAISYGKSLRVTMTRNNWKEDKRVYLV